MMINTEKGLYEMAETALLNQDKLDKIFSKHGLVAVYLFGSHADGTATAKSDYDLGLLFKKRPSFEQLVTLEMEIADEVSGVLSAEVDTVTLNLASIEMKFLIIKQGVVIYSQDDDIRTDFEDIFIRDYLDFRPFLDTFRKEVREAIKEGDFYA